MPISTRVFDGSELSIIVIGVTIIGPQCASLFGHSNSLKWV